MVAKSEPQIWPPHVISQIPHLPTCMSSMAGGGRELEFEESKSTGEKPKYIGRFPKEILGFEGALDHRVWRQNKLRCGFCNRGSPCSTCIRHPFAAKNALNCGSL